MMWEIVVQSTILILAVLIVRKAFGRKMNVFLRYGLWFFVLLRLLLPVRFESEVSLLGFLPGLEEILSVGNGLEGQDSLTQQDSVIFRLSVQDESAGEKSSADGQIDEKNGNIPAVGSGMQKNGMKSEEGSRMYKITGKHMLRVIWIGGMFLTGTALAVQSFLFSCRLRRAVVSRDGSKARGITLPVCVAKNIESPCLAGLFRPVIYVNADFCGEDEQMKYVIIHEWVHYRHGDHIWALFRGICITLYWFNPFVWAAAAASVRDCELACDEGTIARIGEEKRFAYGEMLLNLASVGKVRRTYTYGTLMKPGKTELKERLIMLTQKRKKQTAATVAACVLVVVMTGCAFTGEAEKETQPDTASRDENRIEEDTDSSMERRLQRNTGNGSKDSPESSADANAGNGMEGSEDKTSAESDTEPTAELITPAPARLSLDTPLGVDGPVLDYAEEVSLEGNKRLVFHDYFGLVVYDLENREIYRSLDTQAIGCDMTQGDNYCEVSVSADGETVYLHPHSENFMYRYEIEEGILSKEKFDLEGQNLFDRYSTAEEAPGEGYRSNSIYFEYEYNGKNNTYYGYLSIFGGEWNFGALEYVESDMVFELFPDAESGELQPVEEPSPKLRPAE